MVKNQNLLEVTFEATVLLTINNLQNLLFCLTVIKVCLFCAEEYINTEIGFKMQDSKWRCAGSSGAVT